jgi:hypothetical protein
MEEVLPGTPLEDENTLRIGAVPDKNFSIYLEILANGKQLRTVNPNDHLSILEMKKTCYAEGYIPRNLAYDGGSGGLLAAGQYERAYADNGIDPVVPLTPRNTFKPISGVEAPDGFKYMFQPRNQFHPDYDPNDTSFRAIDQTTIDLLTAMGRVTDEDRSTGSPFPIIELVETQNKNNRPCCYIQSPQASLLYAVSLLYYSIWVRALTDGIQYRAGSISDTYREEGDRTRVPYRTFLNTPLSPDEGWVRLECTTNDPRGYTYWYPLLLSQGAKCQLALPYVSAGGYIPKELHVGPLY